MISPEEFMATEKPKSRSKLELFKSDILTLKNEGYTEASIIKYLVTSGVLASQRLVNKFIQDNMPHEPVSNVKTGKKQSEEKKVKVPVAIASRKFDWQTPVDENEMI